MKNLKEKIKEFIKWVIDECKDWKTLVILLIIMAIVYFPTWGGFLFYYIFKWKWCFAVATAYFAFWMGPFTPFFPLCIAISIGIKKKIESKKEQKQTIKLLK